MMHACRTCPLRRACRGESCRDEQDAHLNAGLMRDRLRGRKAPFWTRLGRKLADNAGDRRAVVLALVD